MDTLDLHPPFRRAQYPHSGACANTRRHTRDLCNAHIASADSGEAQRFEIGVKDIPDANVRAYLLAKYGEPDAAATSVEAASVVAGLGQKISPDTLLFWQFEHQGEPYLVYYARVGQRQLIGGTALKYAQR